MTVYTGFLASCSSFKAAPSGCSWNLWRRKEGQRPASAPYRVAVQGNGKLRDVVKRPATASQTELEAVAKGSDKVKPFLEGKTVKKVIVLPTRLVNIVVG